MRRRTGGIAHVVQAVEEGHQVEAVARVVLGRACFEADICSLMLGSVLARFRDRTGVEEPRIYGSMRLE